MIDHSRIVDDLRSAVLSASADWADFLRAAAADYSVACEEINERLRKCGELLRKGLRSEALQQAEIEPQLLDCVAILDFSEIEQCKHVLRQYGIRAPQPLMLEIAAELNEAYALEQPMTSLLKQHRLLAMSHAPLKGRLAVLQQIAQVDENNPIWAEDLTDFEQARMKEIRQEAAVALGQGNFAAVSDLHQELMQQPWQELPPESLVRQLEEARSHLYRGLAWGELERLATCLHDAYSIFDLATAKALQKSWDQVAPEAGITDAAPLFHEVASVFQWIAEEDARIVEEEQFRTAVATLETLLNRKAPAAALERAYLAVARFQREISEFLEQRYRNRLEHDRLAAARRRKLILAGSAAAILATVSAVAVGAYYWNRSSQIANHAHELAVMLTEDKIDEADRYLKKLTAESPHIAAQPAVQRHARTIHEKLQVENNRHQDFESEMAAFQAEINARRPDQKRVERLLNLAKRPDERRRAQQMSQQHDALLRSLKTERDQSVQKKIAEIANRTQQLNPDGPEGADVLRARLRDLQSQARVVGTRTRDVGDEVRTSLADLEAKLRAIEQRLNLREAQDRAFAEITQNIGNRNAFAEALSAYIRESRGTNRANDFQKAAAEAYAWNAVGQWNALVERWEQGDFLSLSAKDASDLLTQTSDYQDKFSPLCDPSILTVRLPYLRRIPLRFGGDTPLDAKLRRLSNDPLLRDVWQLVHRDGRVFYGKGKPTTKPGASIGFKYIADFSFTEKSIGLEQGDIALTGIAPQVTLGEKLTGLLDHLTDKNWDITFLQILKAVVAEKEIGPADEKRDALGIDPILKLNLLQQCFGTGQEGSLFFEQTFADFGKHLNGDSDLAFVNFLDPSTEGLEASRQTASKIIAGLPDLDALAKKARGTLLSLRKPIGLQYTWIGWLYRDGDQQWRGEISQTPVGKGSLYVCVADGPRHLRMAEVGKLENRQVTISDAAEAASLVEGRPIFFATGSD